MNKAAISDILVKINAFAPIRFFNRRKLPILMYHRFSEKEEIGKTSIKTLESQLEYLTRHYKVISLAEAAGCIREKRQLPERTAVVTIDDGYRDCYELALPVFKKFNVPAVLYVVTDFVEGKCWIWTDKSRYMLKKTAVDRLNFKIGDKLIDAELKDHDSRYIAAGRINSELKRLRDNEKDVVLNDLAVALGVDVPDLPPEEYSSIGWDEARELSAGNITIGSHTVSHPILTNVDAESLNAELRDSLASVKEKLQTPNVHFCYPNGNVSKRERDAAESAGYISAVTTDLKLCEDSADLFMLPRVDTEPETGRFIKATSGVDDLRRRFK